MSVPEIHNEPCACPADYCAHFVEPPADCINRLTGDIKTMLCPICKAATWHQDEQCLACDRRAKALAQREGV
jgi:hypothetical protein